MLHGRIQGLIRISLSQPRVIAVAVPCLRPEPCIHGSTESMIFAKAEILAVDLRMITNRARKARRTVLLLTSRTTAMTRTRNGTEVILRVSHDRSSGGCRKI